jgi:hypothetical protein
MSSRHPSFIIISIGFRAAPNVCRFHFSDQSKLSWTRQKGDSLGKYRLLETFGIWIGGVTMPSRPPSFIIIGTWVMADLNVCRFHFLTSQSYHEHADKRDRLGKYQLLATFGIWIDHEHADKRDRLGKYQLLATFGIWIDHEHADKRDRLGKYRLLAAFRIWMGGGTMPSRHPSFLIISIGFMAGGTQVLLSLA